MKRNHLAGALRRRSGHAGTAIAVDTRPKTIKPRRGRASYDRAKLGRDARRDQEFDRKPPKGGFFHEVGIGDNRRKAA